METWYEHRHKIVHLRLRRNSSVFSSRVFASPNSLFPAESSSGISGRRKAHRPVLRLPVLLRSAFSSISGAKISRNSSGAISTSFCWAIFRSLYILGYLGIKIFYRRRQIAGQYFRGIMIHRQKRDAFSIELTAKFTVFIAANAWATIATCRLCSETFSVRTLRISGQRLINFMRERWAKNGSAS